MKFNRLLALTVAFVFISAPLAQAETILKITDGDTIKVSTGKDVRLLQIDTPEPMSSECYSSEATLHLRN
jgi:endonuclease YncB( thermonuclease family)